MKFWWVCFVSGFWKRMERNMLIFFFISSHEDSFRQDILDSAAALHRPLSITHPHDGGLLPVLIFYYVRWKFQNLRRFSQVCVCVLQIDGNLVAPSDPSNWKCDGNACYQWLYFHRVDGLTLRGRGTIDGRGEKWWQNKACMHASKTLNKII